MQVDESLISIVEKISAMMGEFEDRALNSDELSDLTVKQIYYLDIINKLVKPTFSDLAEALQVTKPTVTLAVNRLINQGYITKMQSSEDRRVYHLFLTEKGERVAQVHQRAHCDFARMITGSLDKGELQQLVSLFQKMIDSYQGETE